MASDKIIKVTPDQIEQMIHDGIGNWFELGLKTLSTWKEMYHECVIINEKRYMLAKMKYGI